MVTHEEWARARDRRDSSARQCARATLGGDPVSAMRYALEWDTADDDMQRLERELDQAGAYVA